MAWREAKLPNLTAAALHALGSDDGQLVIEAATALEGRRRPSPRSWRAPRRHSQRLTALQRETSRDPRVALIERLDELDADRATTLRPYLSDFDPFVAERVAALLTVRGAEVRLAGRPLEAAAPSPADAQAGSRPWRADVGRRSTRLTATTVTLRAAAAVGALTHAALRRDTRRRQSARFVAQVNGGEWNGRTFHRVEPDSSCRAAVRPPTSTPAPRTSRATSSRR